MKLLLDENLPHDFRHHLVGHEVFTVTYMRWSGTKNGALLRLAADAGFYAMVGRMRTRTCVIMKLMPLASTTLAIDGLDSGTIERLESEADRRGIPVASLARELLQQSVNDSGVVHHDLDALAGTWSEQEAAAFDAAAAGTRAIDPELWR